MVEKAHTSRVDFGIMMMNFEDTIIFGETEISLPADMPSACNIHVTHDYQINGPGPDPPYEWISYPNRQPLNRLPVIDFVSNTGTNVKRDFEGEYTGSADRFFWGNLKKDLDFVFALCWINQTYPDLKDD